MCLHRELPSPRGAARSRARTRATPWCAPSTAAHGWRLGTTRAFYTDEVEAHLDEARGARLEVRPMDEGQLAPYFPQIANALQRDGYDGVISFESVYHDGDGDFEVGFRRCIERFKAHFLNA